LVILKYLGQRGHFRELQSWIHLIKFALHSIEQIILCSAVSLFRRIIWLNWESKFPEFTAGGYFIMAAKQTDKLISQLMSKRLEKSI